MRTVHVVLIAGATLLGVAAVVSLRTNSLDSEQQNVQSTLLEDSTNTSSLSLHSRSQGEKSGKSPTISFVDVAPESGVTFNYYGSPSPEQYMTEQNGGGIAVFDFDSDGLVDLFFSNGSHFINHADKQKASNELYRATSTLQYDPVAASAALTFYGFGQGTAAADYDNDGFIDLFVSYFGQNQLWKNNGDGTFANTSVTSGVTGDSWSTSAAFADLDNDGALDLYVVNYVDWKPNAKPCFLDSHKQRRKVCSPMDFNGQSDLVFRNNQDGTFSQVNFASDPLRHDAGKGLALAIVDLNSDSMLDVFVANDTMRNFLYINTGEFFFEDIAIQNGVAFSQDGSLGSSMGVASGDYDQNLLPDLFVTNFAHEVVDAITNLGPKGFITNNSELGLDRTSKAMLNFGIVLSDFDLDKRPDLFIANGHLWDSGPGGDEYRMRPNIFLNDNGKRFMDICDSAGPYFQKQWLGRSVAAGDLDNDGDTDLVVGHLTAPPAILKNSSNRGGQSIQITFVGTTSCRQPLGCCVEIEIDEQTTLMAHIPSGESFQASHDPRLLVATGDAKQIKRVSINWPGGPTESWLKLPSQGAITLIENTGLRE